MKAEIKNGVVTNIIVVDPSDIPDWCVGWPEPTYGVSTGWFYSNGKFIVPPAPEPIPPTREEQEAARKEAYRTNADPIFFMAQRGEATMEEWQAKVAEIKARYPYPAE